jgi:hypothetical protein
VLTVAVAAVLAVADLWPRSPMPNKPITDTRLEGGSSGQVGDL